mmetsp:Transcript_23408/g.44052  ORF Transcript_23408/g.44052 Transcript_23408/m.44052 type:complete len:395 (-) Transcript_23408:177-1361(-)
MLCLFRHELMRHFFVGMLFASCGVRAVRHDVAAWRSSSQQLDPEVNMTEFLWRWQNPMPCNQRIGIEAIGTNEDGEPTHMRAELDFEALNSPGGALAGRQEKPGSGEKNLFWLVCNISNGRATLCIEPQDSDKKRSWMEIPRDGEHRIIHVGEDEPEAVEFPWGLLMLDVLVKGDIMFQDVTVYDGWWSVDLEPHPSDAQKDHMDSDSQPSSTATESTNAREGSSTGTGKTSDEPLPEARPSDAVAQTRGGVLQQTHKPLKFCKKELTLYVDGMLGNMRGEPIKETHTRINVAPEDYVKLGGYRVYNKYEWKFDKTHPYKASSVYWLRCDYDTGYPILIKKEYNGGIEVRPFDALHFWTRRTDISSQSQSRIHVHAGHRIVWPLIQGSVVLKMH